MRWEGHQLVEIENAQVLVRVSMSRGAEILELRDKRTDTDVLWHGHRDIVRNREGTPTIGLRRGNFHDHFSGGWQEVLPSAQFPTELHGAAEGVHGEVAMLPWDWRLVIDSADRVSVEAMVRLRRYPLILTRTMSIVGDRNALEVSEHLVNASDLALSVAWGHHICFDGALAAPGASLNLPERTPVHVPVGSTSSSAFGSGGATWPLVPSAGSGTVDLQLLPPSNGTDGVVIAGPLREGRASIDNPDLDLRMELEWDSATFPYCWSWMVWNGHQEWPLWGKERLITLEPFTTPRIPLDQAAETGSTLLLGPRGEVQTALTMSLAPSFTNRQ